MNTICKMSGKTVSWPCSAAGCPLFGDCISDYETAQANKCLKGLHRETDCRSCNIRNTCPIYSAPPEETPVMTNEEWLKSLHKGDLANTIHAFHLGYAPWCDHHCKNPGENGCDLCITKWPELPATDDGDPSVVTPASCRGQDAITRKHLSEVKQGEKILLLGRHYTALHDAHQDMSHLRKEWYVEASYQEGNITLYECLYENSFFAGMADIIAEEPEVKQ